MQEPLQNLSNSALEPHNPKKNGPSCPKHYLEFTSCALTFTANVLNKKHHGVERFRSRLCWQAWSHHGSFWNRNAAILDSRHAIIQDKETSKTAMEIPHMKVSLTLSFGGLTLSCLGAGSREHELFLPLAAGRPPATSS